MFLLLEHFSQFTTKNILNIRPELNVYFLAFIQSFYVIIMVNGTCKRLPWIQETISHGDVVTRWMLKQLDLLFTNSICIRWLKDLLGEVIL